MWLYVSVCILHNTIYYLYLFENTIHNQIVPCIMYCCPFKQQSECKNYCWLYPNLALRDIWAKSLKRYSLPNVNSHFLYFLGLPSHQKNGHIKRDAFKNSGHSKSFGLSKNQEEPKFQIKPKIIAILRSGLKPRKAVRVLLNNRNTKSFETLLSDLTNTVKLDTGAVRKIFTLDGKPVMTLQDFSEAEVFIAYGVDKCSQDDFDLDLIEFR